MTRNVKNTLAAGLGSLIVLGFGIVQAADTPKQVPRVHHEMVPHVVLPETIQYKKTAKTIPDSTPGTISPYVAAYTPFPSYHVPYSAEFRSVGQSVYPVSPELLPVPLPEENVPNGNKTEKNADFETTVTENLKDNGRDVKLSGVAEPIQLAADNQELIPVLPEPGSIEQTGIFCQHPAKPPTAWSFSSPIFKIASVPSNFGNGQGYISQNGLHGCNQQLGFQPAGIQQTGADTAAQNAGAAQGIPYSTFQLGRNGQQQDALPQTQILPNGMILLTLPPDHNRCGILRCRCGGSPRTMLLPAAAGTAPAAPAAQGAMFMPGGFNPMYQQAAMMNPMMNPMMYNPAMLNQTANPLYNQVMFNPAAYQPSMNQPQILQTQLTEPQAALAETEGKTADNKNPAAGTAAQTAAAQTAPPAINTISLVATPYGFVAVQGQGQQAVPYPLQNPLQNPMQNTAYNPYMNGLYATPYGFVSMGQPQMPGGMMPAMPMGFGMPSPQQNVTMSELVMLLSQMNNQNNQKNRRGLLTRLAERRDERRKERSSDPIAELCQSWATPYISPETSLRMPSRNAYPYGYFGAQAAPISTANYGGYNNLYFGNTTYPGLY
ncbi:MAG: hypothetical protein LBT89_01580 [Planctomycetaceae bacterium]|jgi:hypothetical protein|nr:hypothetical protein [Planctomycetaceae bacterium]